MIRSLVLLSSWLLLAVPVLGERSPVAAEGEDMPSGWNVSPPEFVASESGYNGLIWMSEDFARGSDGQIVWEKLRPADAEGLRNLAQDNSRRTSGLSSDTCLVSLVESEQHNPGGNLAELVQRATHIISGSVVDYKQGFYGSRLASIYQVEPDTTFKDSGTSLAGTFLVRLAMARISTSDGLACGGLRIPDLGQPAIGSRILLFMSEERMWDGFWHVPNAAVFFQNSGEPVSTPFNFKHVTDLAGLEARIIKELSRVGQ